MPAHAIAGQNINEEIIPEVAKKPKNRVKTMVRMILMIISAII
jgi:hypothetical protein